MRPGTYKTGRRRRKVILVLVIWIAPLMALAQAGTLDTTFSMDGLDTTWVESTSAEANAVAVQPDGKILVAGQTSGTSSFAFIRYNMDGTLDNTFDGDGMMIHDMGNTEYCKAVAVQPDGKIVAAGYQNGPGFGYATVVRYEEDGTVDATFATAGIFQTVVSDSTSILYGIAIQDDGKIVVVGVRGSNTTNNDIVAIRLNSDGTRDNSFAGDGVAHIPLAHYETAFSVVIQTDGKVVLSGHQSFSGTTNTNVLVARFNSDGTPDTGFGIGGVALNSVANKVDEGSELAIESDGDIIVSGLSTHPTTNAPRLLLMRYLPSGALDTSFDGDGIVTVTNGSNSVSGRALAIQTDGKYLVGAQYDVGIAVKDFAVYRFETDGTLDASFGTGGIVNTDMGSGSDKVNAMVIHPTNRIIVVGLTYLATPGQAFGIAQYLSGNEIPFVPPQPDGIGERLQSSSWINAVWMDQSELLFSVNTSKAIRGELTLINSMGQRISSTRQVSLPVGESVVRLPMSGNLRSGIYFLEVYADDQRLSKSFFVD